MTTTATDGTAVATYEYDLNNRLLKESTVKGGATDYSEYNYDPNGNQISKIGGSIKSDSGEALTLSISNADNPGNVVDGAVYELRDYNAFNQLVKVTSNGTTSTYDYKPDGLRLSKTVNGTKKTHVWDGSNIILELNASNVVTDRYVRGIGLISSDGFGYFLYNTHGDVVQLSNASGSVTKNYIYDAFGVEQGKVDSDVNPFRYCGEYFDKETETVYLRNRNYSPASGRFLVEDPARVGLNFYSL